MHGQNSNTCDSFTVKKIKPRYINITEDIFLNLTSESLKLYMALRFEADYAQECSSVKKNIQFLINKTKISRRQVFYCLKELETCGLIYRESEKGFQSIYWVAQDYGHYKKELEPVHEVHGVVHEVHGVVHEVHGVVHEVHNIITNTSTNDPIIESITYSNTKESEKTVVAKPVELKLENEKDTLHVVTKTKKTNYPIKIQQAVAILMTINTLGLSEEFFYDLVQERKDRKSSLSKLALKSVYGELIKLYKAGYDLEEALGLYANCTWKGFVADWLINEKKGKERHQHDNDTNWINGCEIPGVM